MSGATTNGWHLWRRQIAVLTRQEIVRSLLSRRVLPVLVLSAMSLFLVLLRSPFLSADERSLAGHGTTEISYGFHFFWLRAVVFFSAAFVFVRLFRGEILERSLHFHLLAPIRREILVVGKYVGGFVALCTALCVTASVCWILMYVPHGQSGLSHMLSARGLQEIAAYLLITALACAAYGALFLLAGLFFKNPMVPAVLFLGWEVATPFLPGFLKVLSVVHYLGSLEPVPISQGPFALLAQPVPGWLAVLALLGVSAGLVALAARRARSLEITYSTE